MPNTGSSSNNNVVTITKVLTLTSCQPLDCLAMSKSSYQIGEVAKISGVSVRMLRHYDRIGLLRPSRRSAAGYRQYDEGDLLRLQQILLGRSCGLALEAIRGLLDDSGLDRRELLLRQRRELLQRVQTTNEMIRSIDTTINYLDKMKEGTSMDMTNLFAGFDASQYDEEVALRWDKTDAYRESKRRTRAYDDATIAKIKEETAALFSSLAQQQSEGAKPDDESVMALAEEHRLSIERWFYPCSPAMHCNLADLYEADPRFARNIDKAGAGLTPFLAAAIRANANQKG